MSLREGDAEKEMLRSTVVNSLSLESLSGPHFVVSAALFGHGLLYILFAIFVSQFAVYEPHFAFLGPYI